MLLDVFFWILGFAFALHFLRKQQALLAEASQLERAKMATSTTSNNDLTRHDIYHIAFLLQQKLPPELVPRIVDQAEFWLKSTVSLEEEMQVADIHIMGRRDHYLCAGVTYLSTLPLGEVAGEGPDSIRLVGKQPVRKVVFHTVSQDQGWSSFPDDHGTDRGCWTWFEAVVRDASQPTYQQVVRDHQENRNNQESETQQPLQDPPQGVELMRNLHALREWRGYSKALSVHDEDEGVRNWMSGLERGQVLDLTVWARYPGWQNRVKSASIDVYLSVIR